MSNLPKTPLTDEQKRRKATQYITGGAFVILLGGMGYLFLGNKAEEKMPPPTIKNASTDVYTDVAPPKKSDPETLGDLEIMPPAAETGVVTIGENNYTGSFTITPKGVSATITDIKLAFAQQSGLKLDTSLCNPPAHIDANQHCPISFIFDPLKPGRISQQVVINANLDLSNGSKRAVSTTFSINGEGQLPPPPPPPPSPAQAEAQAPDPNALSDADFDYLRRRQRPGTLDMQFDPTAYSAMTDQKPIQDNWRSIGYGPNLSTMPIDMTRIVTMDKPIPAVIKLPIDSREGSRAVATVERDIYGGDGRLVVIERGSTLIGTAAAVGSPTEEKVGISWERLVRPDGSAWALQATSGDAMGRSGVIGFIDERWMERFGTSLLASAVVSGLDIATNAGQTTTQSASGSTTTTQTPAYIAGQQFSGNFQTLYSEFAKEQMSITPIITIPVGTRITVFPTTDLWLRPIHPNDDMRAAYARAAPSTPAYVAAEARSQNAMRNAAAGNAGSTSIMPSTVGTQPRNIYASAPAAPAPSLGSVPLTPVNTPGANPDLAIDSVTNAGPAQSTFVNEQPASTTLSQAITMQHGQSAMPIAMPQQQIQTNSPWIPRTP